MASPKPTRSALGSWDGCSEAEKSQWRAAVEVVTQEAGGLAFDHGRLLEEAAELWEEQNRQWRCDACRRGMDDCCETNPYRSAP